MRLPDISSKLKRLGTLDMPVQAVQALILDLAVELDLEEARLSKERKRKTPEVPAVSVEAPGKSVETPPLAPVENKPLPFLTTEKKEESKNPPIIPPSPETENVSRDTLNALALIKGFEDFWEIYPKRAGGRDKPGAFKAFRAALKRAPVETIHAGALRYASYVERSDKSGTEFILQARTWLNRNSWTEDYADARPPPNNNPPRRTSVLETFLSGSD